ncbi:hypothetical protein IHE45_15G092000 [Dioscorea alata]|uniref:Uncharacterized protein n=1 Tax=Dioscorea alata TaxID=55571 RepID=A0ACB7UN40_DIOAL|nr:hypothetical protein IHE45_15G092000 [Dioscorea alata]
MALARSSLLVTRQISFTPTPIQDGPISPILHQHQRIGRVLFQDPLIRRNYGLRRCIQSSELIYRDYVIDIWGHSCCYGGLSSALLLWLYC